MTKFGKIYTTGTVVMRRCFTDGQRDTAKGFMRGFLDGMKTYLEEEESCIKMIQKWTRANRRDEVREANLIQAENILRIPRASIEV